MKKLLVVILVLMALSCLLAVPAFSAGPNDKLIVMDAGGTVPQFVVQNTGKLGLGTGTPSYPFDLSSQNVLVSQMHFTFDGTDTGGWITSASENNFFLSSGIEYAGASGWIQKALDGKSVIAGSSSTRGYAVFLQQGCTQGAACPVSLKLQVGFDGHLGVGVASTAGQYIATGNGAYLSTGGQWTDASSKEYKENIKELSAVEANATLEGLNPVKYSYKADKDEKHVGFIAEDVPDLVATKDRKGLSPLDIVAVLTKVVQEQNKMIQTLSDKIEELQGQVSRIKAKNMVGFQAQQ